MLRASDRSGIAVMVGMFLSGMTLMPLTEDRSYLYYAAGIIAAIQLVSIVGRRWRGSAGLVHISQLLVWVIYAGVMGWMALPDDGGSMPIELGRLYIDAVLQIRTDVAPMSYSEAVRWLMVLLIGAVTIIADMLVSTLETPVWVLAPFMTLYLIPSLALKDDLGWFPFAMIGLAVIVVLMVDGINESSSWTRNLASDSAIRSYSPSGTVRMGLMIGVPSLIGAILIGMLLPGITTLELPSSRPRGSGPLQMENPTVDLSKNLNQPVDRTVLTYQTDSQTGVYLRLASLTVVDPQGWKLAPVDLETGTQMSAAPGSGRDSSPVDVSVAMGDFGTEYLPAPYAPRSFDAEGEWAWDPESLMILSSRRDNRSDAVRNLNYSVTSQITTPEPAAFTSAEPGTPPNDDVTSKVPADVPDAILRLTAQITKDASTPVLKAAAIQSYLGDPRNFAYSTQAPPGDGFDVMVNFLTKDKAGYCIHFAAAMALMSRIEGIPSRVSVGFLPGTKNGDTWDVKASNMHAWPELYFDGYGWVRFEPTTAVASPPEWTQVTPGMAPDPSASASGASGSANSTPTPSLDTEPSDSSSAAPQSASSSGFPWRTVLMWLGIGGGGLAILLAPALVRLGLRRRRLSDNDDPHELIAGGWAELRDTMRDLHQHWPSGSPREIAVVVRASVAGAVPESLDDVVNWVERSRYARQLNGDPQIADGVREVRAALLSQHTWWERTRARMIPRSLRVNLGVALRERWNRLGISREG